MMHHGFTLQNPVSRMPADFAILIRPIIALLVVDGLVVRTLMEGRRQPVPGRTAA